eukprot:6150755-Amphidinium_carterae.1
MQVFKVRAHRSHEDVAGDGWEELLWRGNGLADRLAKQGALGHPGGAEQIQRVTRAQGALQEILDFKAKQAELLAMGDFKDMSAMDEVHEQQMHVGRGRRKRRSWLAPEWLQRLAEQGHQEVMPAGRRGVAGGRAHRDLPLGHVAQRGRGHVWQLFAVCETVAGQSVQRGTLLACSACGAYLQNKARAALQECPGLHHDRKGLLAQRGRIRRHCHPQGGAPYNAWHLMPLPEEELHALLADADSQFRVGLNPEEL